MQQVKRLEVEHNLLGSRLKEQRLKAKLLKTGFSRMQFL